MSVNQSGRRAILYGMAVLGFSALYASMAQAASMDAKPLSGIISTPHSQSIANPAIENNSLLPRSRGNDCISNSHIIFPGGVTLIGHGKKAFDGVCTIQPNGLPAFVLIPVYPTVNFNGVHHFLQPSSSKSKKNKKSAANGAQPNISQASAAIGLSQAQLRSMGQ
jgi:hypothetical protein